MPINDYIPQVHEELRAEQEKQSQSERRMMRMHDSIVAHAFRDAATIYAPKIAKALVTGEDFKVRVDGMRSVPVRTIPMKILTKLWDSWVDRPSGPREIDTSDVERNVAYKEFRQDLEAQGIYIKSMEVFTQTGLNWKRFAKMKLGTDPTPEPRWTGLM